MFFHFLQPAKNLSFYVLMLHHFHIIFLESMFVHRIHHHTSLSGWLFSSSYLSLCLYPTCCVIFFTHPHTGCASYSPFTCPLTVDVFLHHRKIHSLFSSPLFTLLYVVPFRSSTSHSLAILAFGLCYVLPSSFACVLFFTFSRAPLGSKCVAFFLNKFSQIFISAKKLVRGMHTLEQVDWSRMRRIQREIPSSYDELANLCFCNNNNMNGKKTLKHNTGAKVEQSKAQNLRIDISRHLRRIVEMMNECGKN